MRSIYIFAAILCTIALFPLTSDAAKKGRSHTTHKNHTTNYSITQSPRYAGLVVNADTAEIIYSKNARVHRYPASLTKMMTIYLTFEALKYGRIKMDDVVTVSVHAAAQPRSNMNLKPGAKIRVREAIYALSVKSANDVSVAIGEHIAGDESRFVDIMNIKAKKLGLRDTKFCNPHGLHDDKQVSTAYDIAILTLAMQIHFPQYYHMLSKTSFTYNGRVIMGHNKVLERYKWANGGKTGYLKASGYHVVTSTKSPYGRLIAVVMGGEAYGGKDRDDHAIQLLQSAYDVMKAKKISRLNSKIG